MKALCYFLVSSLLISCGGDVEEKKPDVVKEGDVLPGTGLPLVSSELRDKIKALTTDLSHFESTLNDSNVIKVELPTDTSTGKPVLGDDGQALETALQNSIVNDQCLSRVSPGVTDPSFDETLPNYEMRITHSSALNECPIYYLNSISTIDQPTRHRFIKSSAVDLKIDKENSLYENIDVVSYNYSGQSTLHAPPQSSELVYVSELRQWHKGNFISKEEGEVLFVVESEHEVLRSHSSGALYFRSLTTHTVTLNLKVDESDVKVVGYNELSLIDQNGETAVEDKFYINGQEITKVQYKELFTFGPTPAKF